MAIKKLMDENGKVIGYEVRYDTYNAAGVRKQHRKRFDKLKGEGGAEQFDAKHTLSGEDESRVTVKEYFDKWLLHVKQTGKPSYYASCKKNINKYFYAAFEANPEWQLRPGKMRLTKLKRSHIQAVIDWMISKGYSKNTVDGMRQKLCAVMNSAIADEIVTSNPVEKTKSGGKPAREIAFLDETQIDKLLNAMKGDTLYIAAFLASNLGLARGEVSGLKWSSVDLKAKTLTVRELRQNVEDLGIIEGTPKTEKRKRTLPLPAYIVDALKAEKKRQLANRVKLGTAYHQSDYVCLCEDGHPPHPGIYSDELGHYLEAAGLPHTTFHGLRHSCASVLLANGVPLTIVSAILGHSSTQVTAKVYAHALENGKQQAADTLQKIHDKKKM